MNLKELSPTAWCVLSFAIFFGSAILYFSIQGPLQLAGIVNSSGIGFFAGSIIFSSLSVRHSLGNAPTDFPKMLLKLLVFSLIPSLVFWFAASSMVPSAKAIHLSIVVYGLCAIGVGYYLEKK